MFKSRKSTYPSTPKISSISLPDESSFHWFRSKVKSSVASPIQVAMPRPTTPALVEKERIRKDSTSSVKAIPGRVISERTRTNSMSSSTSSQGMPKSILKKTSALPTVKPDILPQSTQYIPIPPKNLRQPPSSVPTAAAGQFRPSSISMSSAPLDGRDRPIHPPQRHASYADKTVKSSAKPISSSYYKKSGCLTDDESYSSASSMYHKASASAKSKKSMSDDEGGYPTPLHLQNSSSTSSSSSASLAHAHQQKKRYSHSQSINRATSDYVLVSSAPLKEEAISLSWPLVDNISLSSSPTSSSAYRKRHPHSQGQHLLYFDIGFDPRYDMNVRIYRGGVYTRMTAEEGDIPASSHCTIEKMTIVCKELSRWPIIVSSSSSRGVRCMDVFYAIYKTFHEPLTSREKRELDKDFLSKCQSSFEQRCRDSPGLAEYNRHQGLRRVDLLRGNRIFQGLKQDGKDWILMIYKPSFTPSSS